MYDLDVSNAIDRLNKIEGCELLLSNPCIEVWFLLHYKNQTANCDCSYSCKELKNRNRAYAKGKIDDKLKIKLSENYKEAIKRAKNLNDYDNPSSTIYKFLEKLIELKEKS
jgi:hypothetical protein